MANEVTNVEAFMTIKDVSDGSGVVADHEDKFRLINFHSKVNIAYNETDGQTTGKPKVEAFEAVFPWSKGAAVALTKFADNEKLDEVKVETFDITDKKEAALTMTFTDCYLVGHEIMMGSSAAVDAGTDGFEAMCKLKIAYRKAAYECNSAEGVMELSKR